MTGLAGQELGVLGTVNQPCQHPPLARSTPVGLFGSVSAVGIIHPVAG